MIQTLASTTNFTIQYQDNFPNAIHRAQKLKADAENEFAQLRSWFKNTTGFGTGNRVVLQVDQASLANNNGYRTNGTMKIVMNPFDNMGVSDLADDAVMGLFIAEIIEVLMACRNFQTGTTTWIENHSDGEGLSRMAVGLFHPDGYYQVLGGPFVNGWLQSANRNDWISQNESSDTDGDSFGCSLLFLYWLRSQLGLGMVDMITKAGATLEATYHNLTGNSGAYTAFTDFIKPFFPVGKTATLKTDDPFPLLTGQQRSVQLSFDEVSNGASTIAGQGVAHVSPFLTCPAKDYHYTIYNQAVRLRCSANTTGFGQPVYSWKINGQAVGSFGSVSPTTTVYTDDPNTPYHQNTVNEPVNVNFQDDGDTSTYQGMSHELDLTNGDHLGHESLQIEVSVHEKYASNDTVATAGLATLDAQLLQYENQFYVDGAACSEAFHRKLSQYLEYNWIPIILTLPDPPPDLYRGIRILEEISREIAAVARKNPAAAAEITRAVTAKLGISARLLGSAAGEATA